MSMIPRLWIRLFIDLIKILANKEKDKNSFLNSRSSDKRLPIQHMNVKDCLMNTFFSTFVVRNNKF